VCCRRRVSACRSWTTRVWISILPSGSVCLWTPGASALTAPTLPFCAISSDLRGSRYSPAAFASQLFRAFRPDGHNVHRFRVRFLDRNLLPAIFKCSDEIWIFPGTILHFLPSEDFVVAGCNPSQKIASVLICGRFLIETGLISVGLIRHQHNPHPGDGKIVLVGDRPLNASTARADRYFQGCGDATENGKTSLQRIARAVAKGLNVAVFRLAQHSQTIGSVENVFQDE